MGLAASWEHWDTGSITGPAQWVKDLVLLQLQLRPDPQPGNSICHEAAKKKKSRFKTITSRSSLVAQRVKDPALSLMWLGKLLLC